MCAAISIKHSFRERLVCACGVCSFFRSTLHPSPSTLRPVPSTLRPSPSTVHPAHSTLHPSPSTLHPSPSTLYPSPSTIEAARVVCGPSAGPVFFLFLFTLVTGPRRSWSLKLSNARVYEPAIRARLGNHNIPFRVVLLQVLPHTLQGCLAHKKHPPP